MTNAWKKKYSLIAVIAFCLFWTESQAQIVPLNDLTAFKTPAANWKIAGKVLADPREKNAIETKDGTGIIVNVPTLVASGQAKDLIFNLEHGDAIIEFDFLMAAGSNSGVYLQGRYEIQLLDSWGKKNPSSGDCGGVYERWDESKPAGSKGYEGHAPRVNASRAPGLWQKMKITFQAPRFNDAGTKLSNAKIIRIEHNGTTIQDNVELTGPTRAPLSEKEVAKGPLRIQGDHGPVAFRNISIKALEPLKSSSQKETYGSSPIFLNTADECLIHRSFISYSGKKIPHGVSVGDPLKINYAMDLDNGSILRVWRGDFLDVTPMWNDRGNGMSLPLGSPLNLGFDEGLSSVGGKAAEGFRFRGYKVDNNNRPIFQYEFNNVDFQDEIRSDAEGKYLKRTIRAGSKINEFTVTAGQGESIERLEEGAYLINGEYYIKVDGGTADIVTKTDNKKSLTISGKESVSYSLIW